MTYKFVFDPHARAVLPLSVHPGRPPRSRRAGGRRLDVALLTLAVAASIFAFAMLRGSVRSTHGPTEPVSIGASVAGVSP